MHISPIPYSSSLLVKVTLLQIILTLSRSYSFIIIIIRKFGTLSVGGVAKMVKIGQKQSKYLILLPKIIKFDQNKGFNHPQWLLIATDTWHTDFTSPLFGNLYN